ncbi:uncharacterized protein LOC143244057 isoform X2 [Tachypleus tridentatus]|uniref:uncharacterized protein LOC143244057 isoform X2 n=1 Tax=Tachypleus tridentatus TaxID=6853 RepID=UPI003FD46E4B
MPLCHWLFVSSKIDRFLSVGRLSRISDDEEDDDKNQQQINMSLARRRNETGSGDHLQELEKQEKVLDSNMSNKWKIQDRLVKSKRLIPDLKETSEIPQTKGNTSGCSMGCENLYPNDPNTVIPLTDDCSPIFPCIPDSFLKLLGLHKDDPNSIASFTEKETEKKFNSLSLAFKTDKLTLNKRLELQQRQRDTAEENVESEIQALRELLNTLNQLSTSHEMRELISDIQQQVDVLERSVSRVSSRAELYGAVQQEEKINRAFEIAVMYVEKLKFVYEKEHQELEEIRQLLLKRHLVDVESTEEDAKTQRATRSLSVAGAPKPVPGFLSYSVNLPAFKEVSRRRASVATFHRPTFLERSAVGDGTNVVDNHPSGALVSSSSSIGSVISSVASSLPSGVYLGSAKSPSVLDEQKDIIEENGSEIQDNESAKNRVTDDPCEKSMDKKEIQGTQEEKEESSLKNNNVAGVELKNLGLSKNDLPDDLTYHSHEQAMGLNKSLNEDSEIIDDGMLDEHLTLKNIKVKESTSFMQRLSKEMVNLDSVTLHQRFRLGLSVILVIAGLLSLLITLLTSQTTASYSNTYTKEVINPTLSSHEAPRS